MFCIEVVQSKPRKKRRQRGVISTNLVHVSISKEQDLTAKKLNVCYWNARSIKNKTVCINDFLCSSKPDFLLLTETWLSREEEINRPVFGLLLPDGYAIQHVPRPDGREGGGVAIVFKESVPLHQKVDNYNLNFKQFENISRLFRCKTTSLLLSVIYRPQPTKANKLSIRLFWTEWKKYLSMIIAKYPNFIIFGDINFHLEAKENYHTKKFHNILAEFGLKQLVVGPTHVDGHTLDIVIVPDESEIVSDLNVVDPCFSNDSGKLCKDHFSVHLSLKADKIKPKEKTIIYRNWKKINLNCFQEKLQRVIDVCLTKNSGCLSDINSLTNCYYVSITQYSVNSVVYGRRLSSL